jgi:tight adherence protein B
MNETLLILSSAVFGLAVALGAGPLFDALNKANRAFFADLEKRMSDVGMSTASLPLLSNIRWSVAVAIAVGIGLMGMVPVGLFFAMLAYNLMAVVLLWRVDKVRSQIRDQLVVVARDFANQVRAGLPLIAGLDATSRDLPAPLGPLLQRVVQQAKQGPNYFLDALDELKRVVRLDGLTVFVIAIRVAAESGGELSVVLDRLSYSLEEQQRVEWKKDSETAAGKMVVWMLCAFPIGFIGLFYALDPEGTGLLFSMLTGQIVLSAVGIVVYASFRWAQRIMKKVE